MVSQNTANKAQVVATAAGVVGVIMAGVFGWLSLKSPGLEVSGLDELRSDIATNNKALQRSLQEGNSEIIQDPLAQLATYGYPLGNFESGETLFLRARSDGSVNVMLTALDANIILSPNILREHTYPPQVLQALATYDNWSNGKTLCQLVDRNVFSLRDLESQVPKNFEKIQSTCPEEFDRALAGQDIRKAEKQLLAEQKRQEAALQEVVRQQEINRRKEILEQVTSACLAYYAGPAWDAGVRQALIKFILTNGQRWDGLPDFEIPPAQADVVGRRGVSGHHTDWLLPYTAANFGVRDDQLQMLKPPTSESRYKTVSEALTRQLKGRGEQSCSGLKIIVPE